MPDYIVGLSSELRAGERVSICWHNEGRWFERTGDRRPIPLAKIPPMFGNGAILFEPTGKGEAAELENLSVELPGGGRSILRPQDPAKPATLIYHARCPYIFSDAIVSARYDAVNSSASPSSVVTFTSTVNFFTLSSGNR